MMARGSSASHPLATGHASSPRHSASGGGWPGARGPSQGSAGGAASLPGQLRLPTTIRIPLALARPAKPAKAPLRIPVTTSRELTGLKIRIPRDLPNLPEVFRKRGAIRSQSSPTASPSASEGKVTPRTGLDSVKRTHSAMMMGDDETSAEYMSYALESNGPKIKIIRRQPPALDLIPPHLATAKNLAIRTVKDPSSGLPSTTSRANVSAVTAPEKAGTMHLSPAVTAPIQGLKRQSKSKSKSSSPISTPAHPASEIPAQATAAGSGSLSGTVVDANMRAESEEHSPSPGTSASGAWASSDFGLDSLKAIGLVRVGMGILDELLSNTFSKSFLNKVPLSMTNYHVKIKKPMDLATIEQKLWKTLEIAGSDSGAPAMLIKAAESLASGVSEGYTNLQEFERDLRKIYQNATLFNSPTHVIYKEAQFFQTSYVNLLTSYRQGNLPLNGPLSQESFRPELISLSEPGPLYLFRAHTLREMERKMTDISTDLFSSFHLPIFDISTDRIGQLSPDHPCFVRLYINKNRSILAKSRDERFARVAILSDVHVGKPYTVSNPAVGSPSKSTPSTRGNTGAGANGGSVSMVRVTAKVLIGKPIGDRHDMVTVGDLDCPNAWVTVACVKSMEIDIEVPTKFEKGTLSKMRHEVVAFSSDSKNGPELQRTFADALGLLLPTSGKAGQAHGAIGLRSAIPAVVSSLVSQSAAPAPPKGLGLGISTPTTQPSSTAPTAAATGMDSVDQKNGAGSNTKGQSTSKAAWVDIHDHGPSGPYLIKMRIPSLLKTALQPPAAPDVVADMVTDVVADVVADVAADVGSAAVSVKSSPPPPPHPIAASVPSTPLMPARVNVLSSQIPATPSSSTSDLDSQSAPDRIILSEQITKRGHEMLLDLKVAAKEKNVPYARWSDIEPTLTVDTAHGLFKRIYHVRGEDGLVVQNFKEMDAESFDQRVREVACLLKLRDLEGVGQIQSIIDNEDDHLVGLSMTKYPYTLKQYATNARRHPTPCQKLSLVCDMVSAMCAIHNTGLAHRDLSEVNIMVNEDPNDVLEDQSARPHVKVIDFGKSVFVERDEVQRWSMQDQIAEDELQLLPLVVLPPDHGYKLYRSILTLPRTKHDHEPLKPVDPRSEDVYSLGVLIWRTFSGKSPWNGAIEDDLRTIRYLVSSDSQIKFQLEREVAGPVSRELLLRCLTAQAETRWTTQQLKDWLGRPEVAAELLKEFEALGGGRKKVRKILD